MAINQLSDIPDFRSVSCIYSLKIGLIIVWSIPAYLAIAPKSSDLKAVTQQMKGILTYSR